MGFSRTSALYLRKSEGMVREAGLDDQQVQGQFDSARDAERGDIESFGAHASSARPKRMPS